MTLIIGEQIYSHGDAERYVVVYRGRLLCVNDQAFEPLKAARLPAPLIAIIADTPLHCLGECAGRSCALVHLTTDFEARLHAMCGADGLIDIPGFSWQELRPLLKTLPAAYFSLAARALQIALWRDDHKFCGRCGTPTDELADCRAVCCSRCGFMAFPRISPCVIGLVVDGSRVLLARGLKHRPELYSCLAGFIEVGESAEQAFAREVKEEVGVEVNNLRYVGSQPWPFPSQLMFGYIADYAGGDICVDGDEITEARWFTRDDLPDLPPTYSISGTIIRDYLKIAY